MPLTGEQEISSGLASIPDIQILPTELLAHHTRFGLGGPARLLVDARRPASLHQALAALRASQHAFLLIGGGIRVADYHANLVYNQGSGRATELVELIDELKRRVTREFGIVLQEEVQYVGFPNRASY